MKVEPKFAFGFLSFSKEAAQLLQIFRFSKCTFNFNIIVPSFNKYIYRKINYSNKLNIALNRAKF